MRRLLLLCVGVALALASCCGSAWAFAGRDSRSLDPLDAQASSAYEQLTGSQQAQNDEAVRRAAPAAVAARARSRHAFSGLDAASAARVARQAFPEVLAVSSPSNPALLASGQRITGYLGTNAARLDLGHGKHGVLESSTPLAALTPSGRAVPIDLRLRSVNGGFEPSVAASGVVLHSSADGGATFTHTGLSIAPAQDGANQAGIPDGGGVLYANTQTDADTLLKPVAQGVAVDALLRSAASPQRLSFTIYGSGRVRLRRRRSGSVSVSLDGDPVANVLPPLAADAAGTPVPVTMAVSGDRLVLDIAHRSGDYQYPIEIDPTVEDTSFLPGHWQGATSVGATGFTLTSHGASLIDEGHLPGYSAGQYGFWAYATQGDSRIEAASFQAQSWDPANDIENRALIANAKKEIEGQEVAPGNFENKVFVVHAAGSLSNVAEYGQWATKAGSEFNTNIYDAKVTISQTVLPWAERDTTNPTVEGKTNVVFTGGWVGAGATSGVFGVKATDPGIGISALKFRSPQAPGVEHNFNYLGSCEGVQCSEERLVAIAGGWFPDGKDTVEVTASNAATSTTNSMEVKFDATAPHDLAIEGLPANAELGNSVYKLVAKASDGAGAVPSSGVSPLAISVDGIAVGTPQGGCSVGPCTTSGEWTISGSQFAVGQHQLTLTATDYAGNTATKEMTIFVSRPVSPVSVGPGNVNPETGELTLSQTDVTMGAASGPLTVSRSFASGHLSAGAEGPLGPSWTLDLGGAAQSIVKLPTGSVLLDSGEGLKSVFTPKAGGEYTPPKGDENLKLVESTVEGKVQFQLTTSGSTMTFKLPAGGTGNTWVPSSESEPNNTNVTTFSYQTAGSVIEPTEVLAPVPANVSCTGTLVRGCRAMRFVYATSTTATGEGASEWGDYLGRLKQVTFTAWDPSTSAMSTTTVGQYSYDKSGRLRAAWDPRISPAVKTTYGYDGEGRVSSLLPAGEQPWLLIYGTGINDVRPGHLLSATRPAPTTAAGPGVSPQNTAIPALSSTNAPEGKTLTVTTGTWNNTPLAYGYQWEECQTIGGVESCAPLAGATNSSYMSIYHGPNRWIKALVTAINANGATTAATASTSFVLPNPYMEKTGEFATKGSGNGQLNNPSGIATDGSGNVWVADTANNRVEKFSAAGAFVAAYGTLGSGNLQFKGPSGIAIDSAGTVWVSDTGNSRVEALTSAGAYAGAFSTGTGSAPTAMATLKSGTEQIVYIGVGSQIDAYHGTSPNLMTSSGVYGGTGTGNGQFTGVGGLAVDETAAKLYATDTAHRVEVFSTASGLTYQSQFGSAGTAEGHFVAPQGLALQTGRLFVADKTNGNVQKFSGSSPLQTFTEAAGVYGVATYPKATDGTMYALNQTTGKIAKWVTGTRPAFVPTPPTPGTSAVETVEYGVPISGAGAPYAMSSTSVANWAQTDVPVEAMAVLPADSPQAWPASSYVRATVYYLDSKGRTVNEANPDKGISTTEYNAENDAVRTLRAVNRAKALEGSKPAEASQLLDSQSTYSEDGSELLMSEGPQHTVKLASGSQVLARHISHYFYDEGAPGTGGPYHLVTKLTEGALLTSGAEEDVHTTVNSYAGQEGLGWKLHVPTSITTDPTGLKIVRTKLYDPATGNVTDAIMPAGNQAGGDAHDSQTIYYTALANSKVAACGLHPEWANMICQTKLAKNPETGGVPNPPVTTLTYNVWDESAEVTAVFGANSRKSVMTYDSAGRPKTATQTATTGTALPTVTVGYDSNTGRPVTSSTTEGSTTRALTSVFDKWGEMSEYTDADGVTSKYTHDIDGRTLTANDGKATQEYKYDPATGFPTSLLDGSGLNFIAEYDVEGNIKAQYFGNGMVEKHTYDATGQPTALEYVDQTECSSNCTWYSDSIVPSITGQWLTQSSTLSSQTYKYDTAARLTQVQDTPAGQGCTTRLYGYDADSNRTTQTTRNPGTGGVCATEGGTVVGHSYDSADRLIDAGATYDGFGNTTSLPAGDAGGTTLTSSFYSNGVLATQTQNGQTNGSYLDPKGRQRELVATGTKTGTSVMHYSGGEDSPSWVAEGATGWSRNIVGLSGSLVATQSNGELPILQITNLHGDVVGTASPSESANGLATTNDATEFGVPRTSTPPKYSWLGGLQRATTLPSGVVAMGVRSYVPQIGRFLQTDPVPGGSANAYAYTSGDPVNTSDPSGESSSGLPAWLFELNDQIGAEIVAREAAKDAAARAAADAAAEPAAVAADATPGEFMGGWSDPEHKVYWNYAKTMKEAETIRNTGNVESDFLDSLFPEVGALTFVRAFLVMGTDKQANLLEQCASTISNTPRATCLFDVHTLSFLGIDTAQIVKITIGACWWVPEWGGHKAHRSCGEKDS